MRQAPPCKAVRRRLQRAVVPDCAAELRKGLAQARGADGPRLSAGDARAVGGF